MTKNTSNNNNLTTLSIEDKLNNIISSLITLNQNVKIWQIEYKFQMFITKKYRESLFLINSSTFCIPFLPLNLGRFEGVFVE